MRSGWRMAVGATVWLILVLAMLAPVPVQAADVRVSPQYSAPLAVLPFARSERSQAVWAADACFRDCGAYCSAGQASCLYRDSQGQCLRKTDECDRYCQRNCRTAGGPWLPLDF